MNESPLISVIIPVYKVEKYLDACVGSVVDQTYKNLEIILVDDGSPDRCPAMCDAWAEKDARIRVIHKKNGGLSDARNAGLKIAAGGYVSFVDSDDFTEKSMTKKLLFACEKYDADVAECGYLEFEKEEETFHALKSEMPEVIVKGPAEALNDLLDESTFKVVAWNKLYRKELFKGLGFETGRQHEDVFFTYRAFGASRRVAKVEEPLYAYRKRDDSIMGNQFSLKNLDAAEACRRRYYYMLENYPKLAAKAQARALGLSIYLAQQAMREAEGETAETAVRELKLLYDGMYRARDIEDSAKQKFWYRFAKRDFSGCCRVRNLLKIGI